ncbi:hypothetical protein B5M09_004595 [Aphanomyces astaci]|uniref:Uncharacterized protein n=1 Tax=Aphanomyces astaci TaxID=112090 RepID=A0A3R8DCH2_APHAT|nr:hypothetical protein B5M09_004595 [Aphanomyces astaci]
MYRDDHHDLADRAELSEAALVQLIESRFRRNLVYTHAGSVLLAVNPFRRIEDLYGQDMLQEYESPNAAPHIYGVAANAYRAMQLMHSSSSNQTILISGDSGSGKTECTKRMLDYFVHVGRSSDTSSERLTRHIVAANVVLEAFGNAQTLRNSNSSRFGKFIQLDFSGDSHRLFSASIQTYLLETVRIVNPAAAERNYHVFYALLSGAPSSLLATWQLVPAMFTALETAMTSLGLPATDVYRVVAVVLHLGNVSFDETNSSVSTHAMAAAASLLQVPLPDLQAALTTRALVVANEVQVLSLSAVEAAQARDGMAKALYARLFEWLVEHINGRLNLSHPSTATSPSSWIAVLDMFGFEHFGLNSFEQLCINYTNEVLHQHFVQHVFKLDAAEYAAEGLACPLSTTPYVDNEDCIALFSAKHTGLFALLDEECVLARGSDAAFASKLHKEHATRHPRRFTASHGQLSQRKFTIHHYAGSVEYTAVGFRDKNFGVLAPDVVELLRGRRSTDAFVRQLFQSSSPSRHNKPRRHESVASQFQSQLGTLMKRLHTAQVHYVRCLKPNDAADPALFLTDRLRHQLRCHGILDAIRIAQLGFPVRLSHAAFQSRYRPLLHRQQVCDEDSLHDLINALVTYYGDATSDRGSNAQRDGGELSPLPPLTLVDPATLPPLADYFSCSGCTKRFTLVFRRKFCCLSCRHVVCSRCCNVVGIVAGKKARVCLVCAALHRTTDNCTARPCHSQLNQAMVTEEKVWHRPWPEPPLPDNEMSRLAAVARLNIDDVRHDMMIQHMCTMVYHTWPGAVAFVGIMGKMKQVMVTSVGSRMFPDQLPRDMAFCAHTICGTKPLVVMDATKDPRFMHNPLVKADRRSKKFCFYLGAAVVDLESRHILGTIAVLHTISRKDSVQKCELQVLENYARVVSRQLTMNMHGWRPDDILSDDASVVVEDWLLEGDDIHVEMVDDDAVSEISEVESHTTEVSLTAYMLANRPLYDIMIQVQLFANLSQSQQEQVLKALKPITFKDGETIVKQGDRGERFFMIAKGEAVVTKLIDGKERMVTHLYAGHYFGELALIYDDPRTASVGNCVHAVGPGGVELLYLTQKDFQQVGKVHLSLMLQQVPLLAHLSARDQDVVLTKLKPSNFGHGEYIVRQGEEGTRFYMITRGQAAVIETDAGEDKELTRLYEGHVFGEMSLIYKEPRTASVVAVGPVKCLYLTKEDFDECLLSERFQRVIQHAYIEKATRRAMRNKTNRLLRHSATAENATSFTDSTTPNDLPRHSIALETSTLRKHRLANGETVVNKYVIKGELGKGSFGTVKLCANEEDGQLYAVKIMHKTFVQRMANREDSLQDALRREVAIMKKLDHRNVVRLVEVIDDPSSQKVYLVQEYIEKGNLAEVAGGAPLPEALARKYLRDMLCGLQYLHFHKVVHRDIKPENILVTSDDVAKIADFGAARMVMNEAETLTVAKGTPAFMAPEMFNIDAEYTGPSVDVWSLGATLFMLVFGHPPWSADNEIELADKVQRDELTFPEGVVLEPHLKNLLTRMLTKDPERRIVLADVINHEWVTCEGSHPIVNVFKGDQSTVNVVSLDESERAIENIPERIDERLQASLIQAHLILQQKKQQPPLNLSLRSHGSMNSMSSSSDRGSIATTTSSPKRTASAATVIPHNHHHHHHRHLKHPSTGSAASLRSKGSQDSLFGHETSRVISAWRHHKRVALMDGHNLSERVRDLLLEQKRMAFSVERAHVTEIILPASKQPCHTPTTGPPGDGPKPEPLTDDDLSKRQLSRKKDFLMVTSEVFRNEAGDYQARKVLFQATSQDFSVASRIPLHPLAGSSDDVTMGRKATNMRKSSRTSSRGGGTRGSETAGDADADVDVAPVDDDDDHHHEGMHAVVQVYVSSKIRENLGLGLRAGYAEAKGSRPYMEDRSLALARCPFDESVAFFGVFDGHNGSDTAMALQADLHHRIWNHWTTTSSLSPQTAIELGCRDMDDELLRRDMERIAAQKNERMPTPMSFSGSAAVFAVLVKQSDDVALYVANVGDCRGVLCQDGDAIDLTIDHKANNPSEKARVEAAGGFVHNGRLDGILAVSRAFGDFAHKSGGHLIATPEVTWHTVSAADEFLLLASDGLFDVLSSQQAVNFIRRKLRNHGDVQLAAQELVLKAQEYVSHDNISAIVVCFNQVAS